MQKNSLPQILPHTIKHKIFHFIGAATALNTVRVGNRIFRSILEPSSTWGVSSAFLVAPFRIGLELGYRFRIYETVFEDILGIMQWFHDDRSEWQSMQKCVLGNLFQQQIGTS
jgi:hypothetical protein